MTGTDEDVGGLDSDQSDFCDHSMDLDGLDDDSEDETFDPSCPDKPVSHGGSIIARCRRKGMTLDEYITASTR